MLIRIFFIFLTVCCPLAAVDTFDTSKDNFDPAKDCTEAVLVSFFPERVVNKALARNKVPSDWWGEITMDLSGLDEKINAAVDKKAAAMNPNPLDDLTQRSIALKLIHDTKMEYFSAVLKKHGVTEEATIQNIFDTIEAIKKRRFEMCIERQGN